jgi:hypothetical protein
VKADGKQSSDPPKSLLTIEGLHGVISQMLLFITTGVRTSDPATGQQFSVAECTAGNTDNRNMSPQAKEENCNKRGM